MVLATSGALSLGANTDPTRSIATEFGLTGNVTLSAASTAAGLDPLPTSIQDFYGLSSGVPTFLDSEVIATGTTWTPSTSVSYRNIHVWVIGAGGGGGVSSTDGGREKISNGGGAGGTAYRVFTRAEAVMGATLSIGTGGAGNTVSGGGSNGAGFPGGNTTFTLAGVTMTGNGGEQGKGGRNTDAVGSTVNTSGSWGAVSAVSGGTASGGTENYTGGGNIAYSIGGDGSQATSGGSTNVSGQTASALNGVVISGGGFRQGNEGPRPSRPSFPDIQSLALHWPTDSFRGGAAQQHSSGGPVTGSVGNPHGAGGGSASAESSTATSGAGGNGAVVVLYEGSAPEIPVPPGITLPLNYGNFATFDLTITSIALTDVEGPSWDEVVAHAIASGAGTPGFNQAYTTDANCFYTQGGVASGPAQSRRSTAPTITTGSFVGGRPSVNVTYLGGTNGNITINMWDEATWDTVNHQVEAIGDTITWTDVAIGSAPDWFTNAILTDHNGNTLTLAASDFSALDPPSVTSSAKSAASTRWEWVPTSTADWGDFNPRGAGTADDDPATANFQWGSDDVTITLEGYVG